MNIISRRTAICNIAISATFVYGRDKGTAFALIGDRYHNSDYIRTALGKTLGKNMGLAIDFCDEVRMLDAETIRGYKLLIILRDGMTWPEGYADESSNAAYSARDLPRSSAILHFRNGRGALLLDHTYTRESRQGVRLRRWRGAVLAQRDVHKPTQ